MNRRELLSWLAGSISSPLLTACRKAQPLSGSIVGASVDIGHLLRAGTIPQPRSRREIPIVIAGGGIAGLSAGWWLLRHGVHDFQIFELESETGGNSRYGRNSVSAY